MKSFCVIGRICILTAALVQVLNNRWCGWDLFRCKTFIPHEHLSCVSSSPTVRTIHVQYTYIMRFMAIFKDIASCPLKPKNFMNCSLVRFWLKLGLRGTPCDAYTKCQESHCSGVLDNPHENWPIGAQIPWCCVLTRRLTDNNMIIITISIIIIWALPFCVTLTISTIS